MSTAFQTLSTPTRLTDHNWPQGTLPVVSVCCITYNHGNFIRDAIEGFLMQETTFPVEILIHDDASTDGTAEIVRGYQTLYPELIKAVLQTENQYSKGGAPGRATRARAKGEFIALCEGDDHWTCPAKLEVQVDYLKIHESYSGVFHNCTILNEHADPVQRTLMHEHPLEPVFHTEDLLRQWFIPTASCVFRNYNDFAYPEWASNCSSGDIVGYLLRSLRGPVGYIPENMSVYRQHPGGISNTHYGYKKVIDMIYLYQSFNIHTERRFEQQIQTAIIDEIRYHLPEIRELEELKAEIRWRSIHPCKYLCKAVTMTAHRRLGRLVQKLASKVRWLHGSSEQAM